MQGRSAEPHTKAEAEIQGHLAHKKQAETESVGSGSSRGGPAVP